MDEESDIDQASRGAPQGWIGNAIWPRVLADGRRLVHGVLPIQPGETPGKVPLAEALGVHREALEKALGAGTAGDEKIIFIGADQVHGENIEVIKDRGDLSGGIPPPGLDDRFSLIEFPETDGIIAQRPNVVLVIQTADCLPILFFDPVTSLIGACHCGWRGLIAGLAGKTAARMIELGARKETLEVWIGPGIGVENYEVGAELVGRFEKAFPDARISPNGTHLDLAAIASADLRQGGVGSDRIADAGMCTFADKKRLHSYRRDGDGAGRLLTLVGILGTQ